VQVVVTPTLRPDGSLNELVEVVLVSLTFVIVVGFVAAVALDLVMTWSVHTIVFPDQPGDVLTL
jgi:hypothetical protein